MKYCPKCGEQLVDAARFCRACGARLAAPTTSVPKPTPPPAAPPATTMPRSHIEQPRATSQASLPLTSVAVAEEEDEIPPPPPSEGMRFTWQRDTSGHVRPIEQPPEEEATTTDTPAAESAPQPAIQPVSSAGPITLPAAPTPWKFREQTTHWANALNERFCKTAAAKNSAVRTAASRLIEGALFHREIYRNVAQCPERNKEAFYIAGAILLAEFMGLLLSGGLSQVFGGFSVGLLWRTAVIRIIGWVCALFAVQFAAKTFQQIRLALPASVWFRALVYAQAPMLLSVIPGLQSICGIWTGACTAAALYDVTGRGTKAAVTLMIIAAIASAIGMYVATLLLR